jgi:3' terminal RNA ribose 2'-O-methyltransferase Hen1
MVRFPYSLDHTRKEFCFLQLVINAKGSHAQVLSHLLAKNPHNLYERTEKEAVVRLVYNKYEQDEVEVFLYAVPDPIELVHNSPETYDITQYINDREFAVSSLFLAYIRNTLSTALNGKPKEEYHSWVAHPFALEIKFGPVATHLQEETINALFAPMGYKVEIEYGEMNYQVKVREQSSAKYITIRGTHTLQHALKHIAVLIPVLDNYKHYFLDERELEKLERYGEGWLENHPLQSLILKRTLRFAPLIKKSKFQLETKEDDSLKQQADVPKIKLNNLRYEAILSVISQLSKKAKIVDVGSGEGKLSVRLGFLGGASEILAVEPSQKSQLRALERFEKAKRKESFVEPISIISSLFYTDDRLCNKDVMVLCEVMEHIDEYRLPSVFQTIFKHYQPHTLIVTTPNREYNQVYEMEKEYLHSDHRFEWTREQFTNWCKSWTQSSGYTVTIRGIGEEHELYGFPTQMAVFKREEENSSD